ncbi:DUF523 domain-containing protein [Crossiella sp. SN42]|uniref:DUF523 domain-containing protein n=1 Tax=Crossiella sp. SN42 TaxID=2944808 RepID=UPI0027DF2F6A|nr:DUF523 domain-containing protein [Crossiella sp. SN42]
MGKPLVVSACLAGVRCRYDGRDKADPGVVALVDEGVAVPVCPELLGGLATPRRPAEIVGGDGDDVLDGRARVVEDTGADVTAQYLAGARRMLAIATAVGASRAVLQERSPSCGARRRYDGSFSGTLVDGVGVAAALLRRNGIEV